METKANETTSTAFTAPPKERRTRKALPSLQASAGATEMAGISYDGKVDTSPIQWEAVPLYSVFSLSSDGSYPLVKVSRSKYADLRTGKSEWVGSGRCYLVRL